MNNFLSHENHPFPPSLSAYGQLCLPLQKSHLMDCLEQHVEYTPIVRPRTDVSIMDDVYSSAFLNPADARHLVITLQRCLFPISKKEQNQAQRLGIVWDQYFDNSLKAQTREKRSTGPTQQRRVELSSPIPRNWE